MNAHINYDLAQSLLAVSPPATSTTPSCWPTATPTMSHIDQVWSRVGARTRLEP